MEVKQGDSLDSLDKTMSKDRFEFGENFELDSLRTDRNISKVLAGKVGRETKRNRIAGRRK